MNELSQKQSLMLSQFAYLSIAETVYKAKGRFSNQTLRSIIERIKEEPLIFDYPTPGGMNEDDFKDLFKQILDDPVLPNLRLIDYQNKNQDNGFVAYAFEDSTNPQNKYFAFRGSEGGFPIGSIDWLDNYLLITNLSIQFEDAHKFVDQYKGGGNNLFVTGHSKGGANAAYAAATVEGSTGTTFDAPGIGQVLSIKQAKRLQESGLINYVAAGDIVGAILFHPEKRVFVEQNPYFYAAGATRGKGFEDGHYPQAYYFAGDQLIPAKTRTKESLLLEEATKALWSLLPMNKRIFHSGTLTDGSENASIFREIGNFTYNQIINFTAGVLGAFKIYLDAEGFSKDSENIRKLRDLINAQYIRYRHPFNSDDRFLRELNGHSTGLALVPTDNYPALLHEGESVLTKRESNNLQDLFERVSSLEEVNQEMEEELRDFRNNIQYVINLEDKYIDQIACVLVSKIKEAAINMP